MLATLIVITGLLVLILAALIFLALSIRKAANLFKIQSRRLLRHLQELHTDKAVEQLGVCAEATKRLSAFVTGFDKMATVQVASINRLEESITAFTRLSFGVESAPAKAKSFDELAQDVEIDHVMQDTGMSREEAREQVRQNRTYSIGG